jgi:Xaa-Pro aminopeptidase
MRTGSLSMISHRLALVRGKMKDKRLDALVISSSEHVRYLTGFSGSHGLTAITATDAVFITDPRYDLQSRREVRIMRRLIGAGNVFDMLSTSRILRRCRIIGFEAEALSFSHYRFLRKSLSGATLRPVNGLVEEIALVKDKREKDLLSKAAAISDAVFAELLSDFRPGISEQEVAARISWLNRIHGADGDPFPPLVSSGTRGAFPHGFPTKKRIRRGEFVTIDFGSMVDGYGSDITRTVGIGKTPLRLRVALEVVLGALEASLATARGGMAAHELDAVARKFLDSKHMGRYFVHALGHGLGLRTHERPRVSPLSREVLQPGSVISIEPGVYIPGLGGVRIEDNILLRSDGYRLLTHTPREINVA